MRLRFRILIILAEREMTKRELLLKVRATGLKISDSHFYRQVNPYHSPIRLDLLTSIVRALEIDPCELFDLVPVEAGL